MGREFRVCPSLPWSCSVNRHTGLRSAAVLQSLGPELESHHDERQHRLQRVWLRSCEHRLPEFWVQRLWRASAWSVPNHISNRRYCLWILVLRDRDIQNLRMDRGRLSCWLSWGRLDILGSALGSAEPRSSTPAKPASTSSLLTGRCLLAND